MKRWACVDVPALPLQLLMLRNPSWREQRAPVVVVDVDKPQGRVVWANRLARVASVRPGMRYAAALSIAPSLRAGVVDASECEALVTRVTQRLHAFSPAVEPSGGDREPGVFWVDASGLQGVFVSLDEWGRQVYADLRTGAGLHTTVAVGFSRFGSYALARQAGVAGARVGIVVARSLDDERARTDRVSLDLLQVDTKLRAALDRLGVQDVGALRRLPEGGLAARFGEVGQALARFVLGNDAKGRVDTLVPSVPIEPVVGRYEIEPGDVALDVQTLLFLIKTQLGPMFARLVECGQALRVLDVRVLFERASPSEESIEPATPTLDAVQVLDLVRLRLERLDFAAEVVGFEVEAFGVRATREQLELFAERPRRDLRAADRALARLRAEFGDEVVVRAHLREGHLPEAAFCWRPASRVRVLDLDERTRRLATAGAAATRACLVRRILTCPQELPRSRREPDGWFAAGLQSGPIRRTSGPYVLSGGWWRHRGEQDRRSGTRSDCAESERGESRHREVHRAYHFAETDRGDLLWVFYDRVRRRWYLHGMVE